MLKLPKRTLKPRNHGITSIYDVGCSIGELRSILADYHAIIDFAKLGIGSAYVTSRLREKISLYKEYDVIVYFGGTLFEKFYYQSNLVSYKKYLESFEIDWVEVSTGIVNIPLEKRLEVVQDLKNDFNVLAEVGMKDSKKLMMPSQWTKEMRALVDTGCSYVIAEGRVSGTAGIYHHDGEIKEGLISEILNVIDANQIIFEAPKPKMQSFFINLLGANVNVGNVPLSDLLLVETQRCGLRKETFFMSD